MAFPSIVTIAENSVNTAGTTHAITLPTGILAGSGIIIILDKGSTAATFNTLAGWNEIIDVNAGNGMTVWYRQADGTEGATVTFTSSANTRSASIAYNIAGQQDFNVRAPEISTVATGTSVSPGPNTCTPTGGAKDYLWIAFAGMAGEEADDDTWANTPPTNYLPSPPTQKSCGTAGVNLGGLICAASRTNNAASESAATFNVDVSAAWNSYTLAIHPQPQDIAATSASYSTDPARPPVLPKPTIAKMLGVDTFIPAAASAAITVQEMIPQMATVVSSMIAVSGWVFTGAINQLPNFASMQPPMPPLRAPRPMVRPYTEDYYRYANDAQSAIGLEQPSRPVAVRKSIIRNDDNVFMPVGPVLALTEPLRPVTVPTRRSPITVLLPLDVFIPTPIAASYPHTGPQPILVPGAPTQNYAFVDEAFIFVPLTPPGTEYPVGLEGPIRPTPGPPKRYPRIDQVGTVGVFFYEISQPFDWNDMPTRPPFHRARIRRPEIDPFIPVAATPAVFPIGLTEPARPFWRIKPTRGFETDPFLPAVIAPTYDYGWYSAPQLPMRPKESLARLLGPDLYYPIPGNTYGYDWYAPPRLPIRPKESNARVLTPDTIYPTTGNTYDFGWYAPPRLPIRPAGSNAIFSEADNFLIPPSGATYDYGWYSEPQRPVQPKGSNAIYLIPDYWPWENIRPDEGHPHFGGWPHKKGGHLKKKKRKDIPAFEDRLPTARQTLLQVLADIQERQDEEDILMILKKIYDS